MRITPGVVTVLQIFLRDPDKTWFGMEIAREAALSAPTTYGILSRLAAADILSSTLENADPRELSRPLYRHYRLLPERAAQARELVDAHE